MVLHTICRANYCCFLHVSTHVASHHLPQLKTMQYVNCWATKWHTLQCKGRTDACVWNVDFILGTGRHFAKIWTYESFLLCSTSVSICVLMTHQMWHVICLIHRTNNSLTLCQQQTTTCQIFKQLLKVKIHPYSELVQWNFNIMCFWNY